MRFERTVNKIQLKIPESKLNNLQKDTKYYKRTSENMIFNKIKKDMSFGIVKVQN